MMMQGRAGGVGRAAGPGMAGPAGLAGCRAARKRVIRRARCASSSVTWVPTRSRSWWSVVFAIASTVFSIVSPKILGQATTALFNGMMAGLGPVGMAIDFAYIGRILLTVLGLYLFSALFAYIQGWVMAGVAMKVTYRFRKDIGGEDQPDAVALLRRHESRRGSVAGHE